MSEIIVKNLKNQLDNLIYLKFKNNIILWLE